MLVEERYLSQRQPAGLIDALARRDVPVIVAAPESLALDLTQPSWLETARLIVARGRSVALLTALRVAERFAVPTVNRSAAVEAVRDKAAMAAAFASAGIPTPPSWTGAPSVLARTIPPSAYPLVLKPVFGDNGRGVRRVASADELSGLRCPEGFVLAQSFVPGDGFDLKLYAVGDQLWAVRAPSLLGSRVARSDERCRVPVTAEMRDLARACGALFGLELFGVDCLTTPDGLVVVEVNDFPNYRGVPEADLTLADYVSGGAGSRP